LKKAIIAIAAISLFSALDVSAGGLDIPERKIESDECYYGCCHNEEKKLQNSVKLFTRNGNTFVEAGIVSAGSIIKCITSEKHYLGSKFTVKKPFCGYNVGDVIMVYEYLEEGIFKVWRNGEISELDLGFDPSSEISGSRCQKSPLCVGTLEKELDIQIWYLIMFDDGKKGWIRNPRFQ